jgi:hypothetical protein
MADYKATVASGADPNGQQLRQRNVPATASGAAVPYQQDEQKIHSKKKVHGLQSTITLTILE